MDIIQSYKAYLVTKDNNGKATSSIVDRSIDDLPEGDVLIRVHYSSLNYKDALSATGAPGVTKNYPHVPGIDAAGEVELSSSPEYKKGDHVLVTGYDLGVDTDGGYGQYIRVPAKWVVPVPNGLTIKESMILGTAGFTAGLCLQSFIRDGQRPDDGEVVVTGASGGVGSIAVALLAKAGYTVAASTGKTDAYEYLRNLGASRIIDRSELNDQSGRPLLKGLWAGAVDTVGGNTLSTIIKSTKTDASIAACGVAGGAKLDLTVFPFILRGVRLLGIDSALCPGKLRLQIWNKLATEWKPNNMEQMVSYITLSELDNHVNLILKGKIRGRIVVKLDD